MDWHGHLFYAFCVASMFRYYLKGSKAGTHDVFVDGLPGMPDNLRPNGKGGFYITLFAPPNQLVRYMRLSQTSQLRCWTNGIYFILDRVHGKTASATKADL